MKTPRWVLVALLLGSGPAAAAVCTTGPLSDYIAFGAAGCTIDGVKFSDFTEVAPLNPAATPISPSLVNLTPLTGPGGPGFGLASATALNASAGNLLELWFGFVVTAGSGDSLMGGALSLGSSTVVPDGADTIIADICPDGAFASPSSGCSTFPVSLIVFDVGSDASPSDSTSIVASSFFDVFVDIVIDGGPTGDSTLGPTLGEFRTAVSASSSVPEPSTWWLATLVLAAAACARRPAARRAAVRGTGMRSA
jgi:hypothetical protein